jgi:hypothetical protein
LLLALVMGMIRGEDHHPQILVISRAWRSGCSPGRPKGHRSGPAMRHAAIKKANKAA